MNLLGADSLACKAGPDPASWWCALWQGCVLVSGGFPGPGSPGQALGTRSSWPLGHFSFHHESCFATGHPAWGSGRAAGPAARLLWRAALREKRPNRGVLMQGQVSIQVALPPGSLDRPRSPHLWGFGPHDAHFLPNSGVLGSEEQNSGWEHISCPGSMSLWSWLRHRDGHPDTLPTPTNAHEAVLTVARGDRGPDTLPAPRVGSSDWYLLRPPENPPSQACRDTSGMRG